MPVESVRAQVGPLPGSLASTECTESPGLIISGLRRPS
jgi:hypothetical protein